MKIFNKEYILTKFPLLWNTRFVRFATIAIGLNILFFFIGFFSFVKTDLFNSSDFPKVWVVVPSILVSFLFLIIWVMHYTRHNAFKDLLPIKRFYLQKEFLLVLVILFLNLFYLLSFKIGYDLSGRLYASDIDIIHKTNKANQAMMFVPLNEYAYEIKQETEPTIVNDDITKYKNVRYDVKDSFTKVVREELNLSLDDQLSVKEFYLNDLMRLNYPKLYRAYHLAKDSISDLQDSLDKIIPEEEYEEFSNVSDVAIREELKEYAISEYGKSSYGNFVSVDADLLGVESFQLLGLSQIDSTGESWIENKEKDSILQSLNWLKGEMKALGLFCEFKKIKPYKECFSGEAF